MRADLYLYSFGYAKSRQKAKSLIEAGNVKINSKVIKKPSFDIDEEVENKVEIIDDCPYVSRGGLKLEKMLDILKLDLTNKIAVDIGASTGGFTDCLLKKGVRKVFAVDSGTNQLDSSLINDLRVVSMEGFNARDLTKNHINCEADIITVDVSFISQTYILPVASDIINSNGVYIGLIKPQFEVGKSKIGKGGIVKEQKYRIEAVKKIVDFAKEYDFKCISFTISPIQGGDGNVEYVAAFSKSGNEISFDLIKNIANKKEEKL